MLLFTAVSRNVSASFPQKLLIKGFLLYFARLVKKLTGSGLIWFSEALRVHLVPFFQEMTCCMPCALTHKFWNSYGGQKIKFHFVVPIRCAMMRGFQIWSQNSHRITFDPFWLKNGWGLAKLGTYFASFWAKRGTKCYSIWIRYGARLRIL